MRPVGDYIASQHCHPADGLPLLGIPFAIADRAFAISYREQYTNDYKIRLWISNRHQVKYGIAMELSFGRLKALGLSN